MMLRRDIVNQKLRAAGIPDHIVCRKRIPQSFGLPGALESNIIFDESQDPPLPLAVLGWEREADENLEKFLEGFTKR